MHIDTTAEPSAEWAAFAQTHGMFYHRPEWISALGRVFRFRLHWLTAREGGVTLGILPLAEVPALFGPRRVVSLPFGYAAGPVGSVAACDALLTGARIVATHRGLRRVEIKRVQPAALATGYERVSRYATYRLDTSEGVDALWQRLDASSTRRGVRKAERSGVTVSLAGEPRDWLTLAALQEETSHHHGVPAPPREFFSEAVADLAGRGLAALYLASQGGRGVTAAVLLWKGTREWIYAFGPSRRDALESRPIHALLWRAVRDAAAAGVTFDLGRAAPEQTGLVQFKERWGGVPTPLAYDYWPRARGLNVKSRDEGSLGLAARVWSRLPSALARRGAALYRYLG